MSDLLGWKADIERRAATLARQRALDQPGRNLGFEAYELDRQRRLASESAERDYKLWMLTGAVFFTFLGFVLGYVIAN